MGLVRRRSVLVAIAGLALMALAAPGALAQSKTKLTFWHLGPREFWEPLIEQFERENPDLEVELADKPSGGTGQQDSLAVAIAGGAPPDVSYMNRFIVAEWAFNNQLMALDDFIARDETFDLGDWVPAAINDVTWNGKIWALPFTMGTYGMIYNRELFAQSGLDPAAPPRYIDQLDEAASRITRLGPNGEIERMGIVPWVNQGWMASWGWAFGGEIYDAENRRVTADHPRVVEALEWMVGYAERYGFEQVNDWFGSNYSWDRFLNNQIGVKLIATINLDRMFPGHGIDYGIFPFPSPRGVEQSTWQAGFSYVIPYNAPNPEAAWRLLRFVTSAEVQALDALQGGNFPSVISGMLRPEFFEDPLVRPWIQFAIDLNVHSLPPHPAAGYHWSEINAARNEALQGLKPARQALVEATQRIQARLDEILARGTAW